MYHAKQCLDICTKNGIGDFDIAFAYEAMARAYNIAGDEKKYKKYYEKAENAGKQIEDSGNKEYFMGELKTA